MVNCSFMKKKNLFAYVCMYVCSVYFAEFHRLCQYMRTYMEELRPSPLLYLMSKKRVRGLHAEPIGFQGISVCISTGLHYKHKNSL
jgi:hypothetical protein